MKSKSTRRISTTMKSNVSTMLIEQFEFSEDALDTHQQLVSRIQAKIAESHGVISFAQFMQMALYQPKLGYYQNSFHKFGKYGDFVTAPEMGKSFARCLARSFQLMFSADEPKKITNQVLEIGAGSGILAVELIKELQSLECLPCRYYILETSAELQLQQKQLIMATLPEYYPNVEWLSALPKEFNGVIVANEVADAIPFELIKRTREGWVQLGVCFNDNHFEFCDMEVIAEDTLPKSLTCENLSTQFLEGYITEYRPLLGGWISALANCLNSGAILLVDYGYNEADLYHPQRSEGTLQCFVRHHAHADPLQLVGLQDITAHVNFSSIYESTFRNSLEVVGFTTQAGFLLENGITEINEELALKETESERYRRSQELQNLLLPGQMGEVIKVILLAKKLTCTINGFSLQDHLHRL